MLDPAGGQGPVPIVKFKVTLRSRIVMKKKETYADWLDLVHGILQEGKTVELPILSGSMTPTIGLEGKVRIKARSGSNARVGDIIVFRAKNSLITHRLLFRFSLAGRTYLYQKGDANRFGYWINQNEVVGIVESIQDKTGAIIQLTGDILKIKAKRRAFLVKIIYNAILIIPRGIKNAYKKSE
jgi:signal peptidase I